VAVASFAVNFLSEQGIGISSSRASFLFSFCQLAFTLGRFVGVGMLRVFDPALVLSFYGIACSVLAFATAWASGYGGVVTLFLLFFFESICYPVSGPLRTRNLC
jgi:FHS family L-fucose permease-like MFS transporter